MAASIFRGVIMTQKDSSIFVKSPIPREVWHMLWTTFRLGRPFQAPLSEADRKIVWLDVERNARRRDKETAHEKA